MSFSDWFKRHPKPAALGDMRDTLLALLARKDYAAFYDRAYTHLLRDDSAAALADYQRTLALSPRGFLTAALSADMLTRELAGDVPPGLCRAFVHLEQMPLEQRADILTQMVEKHPSVAAAWSAYANTQPDIEKRLAAIDRGLALQADPDTTGQLLVQKAAALAALGQRDSALAILQRLANDASGSLSAQALAQTTLARLRRSEPSAEGTPPA